METSQIVLNQGLTFLVISTAIILIVVGVFLIRLLINLSKLAKNINETTTIVKSEMKPTLHELHKALESINSIAQNADKQVDSIAKLFENVFEAGTVAFIRAKNLSGGLVKGFVKGLFTVMKFVIKK